MAQVAPSLVLEIGPICLRHFGVANQLPSTTANLWLLCNACPFWAIDSGVRVTGAVVSSMGPFMHLLESILSTRFCA